MISDDYNVSYQLHFKYCRFGNFVHIKCVKVVDIDGSRWTYYKTRTIHKSAFPCHFNVQTSAIQCLKLAFLHIDFNKAL